MKCTVLTCNSIDVVLIVIKMYLVSIASDVINGSSFILSHTHVLNNAFVLKMSFKICPL